jgi:hypothetical protein
MLRRIRISCGCSIPIRLTRHRLSGNIRDKVLPFQSVAVLLVVGPTVPRAGGLRVTLLILPRPHVVRPSKHKEPPGRVTVFTLKRFLGRCEPDFPDLAEFHMLLGLPEIVVVLHGKPTLRRTAKRLGKA